MSGLTYREIGCLTHCCNVAIFNIEQLQSEQTVSKKYNMKILVVDDELSIKRLYQQRFRKELKLGEIELVFMFSGEAALEYLADTETTDLTMVLSDINMPKMSGFELLQEVKKRYPSLKVMIITAYTDPANINMAYDMGATDYLTKPINFKILKDKILSHR